MLLPPRINVPATPAISDIDIRTLYDLDHAKLLGKGGFSEVVAALHYPTGEYRALKLMQRSTLRGKKAEMVTHEKEILRRTCHSNIITLYETIQNNDIVCLSLDLMDEDLFELIVRHKRINEPLTRKIMHQVLSGIAYLHEQSVIHRDIKPENILVNIRYKPLEYGNSGDGNGISNDCCGGSTGAAECNRGNADVVISASTTNNNISNAQQSMDSMSDTSNATTNTMLSDRFTGNVNEISSDEIDVTVKLADFGLAKLVLEWDVQSTPCGTSFYIAPEVIRGIEMQGAKPLCTNKRLVKSVDVWSAGVVFFLLLSGRPPFHGQVKTPEERRALLTRINHGVLFNSDHGWCNVSDEAKDLIIKMLEQDTCRRVTALEALKHPFFTAHGYDRPVPGGDMLARMKAEAQRVREHQQEMQIRAERNARWAAERGEQVQYHAQDVKHEQVHSLETAVQGNTHKQSETNHSDKNNIINDNYPTSVNVEAKDHDTKQKMTNANEYYSSGAASVPLPVNESKTSPVSSSEGRSGGEHINTTIDNNSDKHVSKDAPQHKKTSIFNTLTNFLSGKSSNSSSGQNNRQANQTQQLEQQQQQQQQQQQRHRHHHHHHHQHDDNENQERENEQHQEQELKDDKESMNAAPPVQSPITTDAKQELHAEIEKLRQDMIMADDIEGDETSYRTNMPFIEARPSRPAMMNTKIKVGPQALKRKDK